MDSSPPSTTGRSSTPYSLRAYRTPTRPYRTASRLSTVRLTEASNSPSVPLGMRTTMGVSLPRSLSVGVIMWMPSGSNSVTMATSTFSSERTSMRSPTPWISSSTCCTLMRLLHCSLAGSATYSQDPLPPTTPYARQSLILMTGMQSQRLNATATTMTTTNASLTNLPKSRLSSPLLRTPSPLPITGWKWHEFLLSFLTLRDIVKLPWALLLNVSDLGVARVLDEVVV